MENVAYDLASERVDQRKTKEQQATKPNPLLATLEKKLY
jgi:calcium-dependent protein kinase